MREAFDRAIEDLRASGAEVVEGTDDRWDFEEIVRNHRVLMASEAAATHESLFAERRESYAPQIRALVEEGLATPLTRYVRSHFEWVRAREYPPPFFDGFARGGIWAILTPATLGPAPDTSTTGDPRFNSPWSYLGWPTISVPVGLSSEGLPVAVQIVGPEGSEPFETAIWCESVLRRAFEARST
jgi:aspartyl-tRNA(Asn)/glutamyl-tRNA(Gln) amidotransferase subunit A